MAVAVRLVLPVAVDACCECLDNLSQIQVRRNNSDLREEVHVGRVFLPDASAAVQEQTLWELHSEGRAHKF